MALKLIFRSMAAISIFVSCSFSDGEKSNEGDNFLKLNKEVVGILEVRAVGDFDSKILKNDLIQVGDSEYETSHPITVDLNKVSGLEIRIPEQINIDQTNMSAWMTTASQDYQLADPKTFPSPDSYRPAIIQGISDIVMNKSRVTLKLVDKEDHNRTLTLYLRTIPKSLEFSESSGEEVLKTMGRNKSIFDKLNRAGSSWNLFRIYKFTNRSNQPLNLVMSGVKLPISINVYEEKNSLVQNICEVNAVVSRTDRTINSEVRFVKISDSTLRHFDDTFDDGQAQFVTPKNDSIFIGAYIAHNLNAEFTNPDAFTINAPAKCRQFCRRGNRFGESRSYRNIAGGTTLVKLSLDFKSVKMKVYFADDEAEKSFATNITGSIAKTFSDSRITKPKRHEQFPNPYTVGVSNYQNCRDPNEGPARP